MTIVISIVMMALGVLLVIKSDWFLNNFGRVQWFENNLGSSGGSRLGYKLLGIIILFLGVIFITGSGNNFMNWATSPLTKYNQ